MSTNQQLDSFHKTMSELGPRQREVTELLLRYSEGLSAWQISDKTKRLVHAVRPRVTELEKLGVIRQAGQRWEERTQRHEAVWVLVWHGENGQLAFA